MRLERCYTAIHRPAVYRSRKIRYSQNGLSLIAKSQNFNSLPPRDLEQRVLLSRTNHLGSSHLRETHSLRLHIPNLTRKDETGLRRALTRSPHRYPRRFHRPFESPNSTLFLSFLSTRWLLKARRSQRRSRGRRFQPRKMV
jgi:hypothetical protein